MYEEKKKKEKRYSRTFSKEESNKELVNIVVIRTHSRRRTPKEVSTELC